VPQYASVEPYCWDCHIDNPKEKEVMEDSRRRFLKLAGVSALGLGTAPVIDAVAASGGHGAGAAYAQRGTP
jgi:hypothetical protein